MEEVLRFFVVLRENSNRYGGSTEAKRSEAWRLDSDLDLT
jgi:hypothetical protein